MSWCQCEHKDHVSLEDIAKDPAHVHPSHIYGENCDEAVTVKTRFGTFTVCKPCAESHMAEWLRREAAMENDA